MVSSITVVERENRRNNSQSNGTVMIGEVRINVEDAHFRENKMALRVGKVVECGTTNSDENGRTNRENGNRNGEQKVEPLSGHGCYFSALQST